MTTSEIWTSGNILWSGRSGQKVKKEHKESSMTNCAIHGKGNSIFYWTKATKVLRSEFSHGVDYKTNDKSNELVELPFTITKD